MVGVVILLISLLTNTETDQLVATPEKRDRVPLIPSHTSSETTFRTISGWFEKCHLTQLECPSPYVKPAGELLKGLRFLQILESSIMLVENIQPDRYNALSHCWGSGQPIIRTVKDNIAELRKNGIALGDLPRTFQDAVEICRRLGVKYVWIDSLCIIQNDSQDWHNQAPRMASVYKNSFITIAASKAHDPSEGCFSDTHWSFRSKPLPGYSGILIRRVSSPLVS
jgi:hypothetical protein